MANISLTILSSEPTPAKILNANTYQYLLVGIGNSPFLAALTLLNAATFAFNSFSSLGTITIKRQRLFATCY